MPVLQDLNGGIQVLRDGCLSVEAAHVVLRVFHW